MWKILHWRQISISPLSHPPGDYWRLLPSLSPVQRHLGLALTAFLLCLIPAFFPLLVPVGPGSAGTFILVCPHPVGSRGSAVDGVAGCALWVDKDQTPIFSETLEFEAPWVCL